MVRVRFAPSPTGYLHLGNTRTALLNWLFAKHCGGSLLLRLDNTDHKRCEKEYEEDLYASLTWLGLTWDEHFTQSSRKDIYNDVIETLKESGRVYPCYETSEELEHQRQDNLAKGLPPIYRPLAKTKDLGRLPHWRFALQNQLIQWEDMIQGPCAYHMSHLSDPVIMREDGGISYLLSSVIDDKDYMITHIIRGADHLTNTAIQIQMFEALGQESPRFGHFPLMTHPGGEKLSKRKGASAIHDFKALGIPPLAICQALASLGTAYECEGTLQDMARNFSLDHYGKSMVQWDINKIWHHSQRLLGSFSYTEILKKGKNFLPKSPELSEDLWMVIRGSVRSFCDITHWLDVCYGTVTPSESLQESFAQKALACLPPLPWEAATWSQWVDHMVLQGFTKGYVAPQLRQCLTGQDKGPPMKDLFPLIRADKVYERLSKRDSLKSS
jgi:glutamyl-tRNA synthetase